MSHDWILNLGMGCGREGGKEFIKDIISFFNIQEIYVRTTHSTKILNADFTRFGNNVWSSRSMSFLKDTGKYLGVKSHDACNLLSDGLARGLCVILRDTQSQCYKHTK